MSVRIVGSEMSSDGHKPFRVYNIEYETNGVVRKSTHRYNDFVKLHESIPSLSATRFPAPKSIMPLTDEAAVAERTAMLNDYLVFIIDKVPADERAPLSAFLNVPKDVETASTDTPSTPISAQPPSYATGVKMSVDPASADGRIKLAIKSVEPTATPKPRRLFNTPWALIVLLGVVPLVIVGTALAIGVAHGSKGSDTGAHAKVGGASGESSLAAVVAADLATCSLGDGGLTMSALPGGVPLMMAGGTFVAMCPGAIVGHSADVACKQMGFAKSEGVSTAASPVTATSSVAYTCKGRETDLSHCGTKTISCAADQVVTLQCSGGAATQAVTECALSLRADAPAMASPPRAPAAAASPAAAALAGVGLAAIAAAILIAARKALVAQPLSRSPEVAMREML